MEKENLFKEMIKFDLEKSTFPNEKNLGIPNLKTIELKLIIEIVPENYFYSTNHEFFILSTFEILNQREEEAETETEEPIKKWIFHKILIMNKNIENIFDKYDMTKTEIIPIKYSDDEIKVSQLYLRHLTSVLGNTVKYKILKDDINYNTFFITQEIKKFEKI